MSLGADAHGARRACCEGATCGGALPRVHVAGSWFVGGDQVTSERVETLGPALLVPCIGDLRARTLGGLWDAEHASLGESINRAVRRYDGSRALESERPNS